MSTLEACNSLGHTNSIDVPDGHSTGFNRFPFNNFTYFLLSLQSSFHLSLTVLVRYRSLAII
jgi:hypothetical protein